MPPKQSIDSLILGAFNLTGTGEEVTKRLEELRKRAEKECSRLYRNGYRAGWSAAKYVPKDSMAKMMREEQEKYL